MSEWDVFSGAPDYVPETPQQQARRVDRWIEDARDRQVNLRKLEQSEPVMFEGCPHLVAPVGYDQKMLEKATRSELLNARVILEEANNKLEEHQLGCEIFEENKTRKGGRGRGGKYRVCEDCNSLKRGRCQRRLNSDPLCSISPTESRPSLVCWGLVPVVHRRDPRVAK